MNISFDNKTVLITGSSRGIGSQLASDFESLGANVISLSSSDYNLSVVGDIEKLVQYIDQLEKIDVCINNAGINRIEHFEKIPESDYDDIMMVNVKAPFRISQAVSKKMMHHKYGRIINITSIFGHNTRAMRACYTTSKYALTGMTKTLAVEMARHNVLVNSVAPGFTKTELTEKILGKVGMEEVSAELPIGRLADPEEIAKAVLFLSSDLNTYITGQNIFVDGGFTCV